MVVVAFDLLVHDLASRGATVPLFLFTGETSAEIECAASSHRQYPA
jgi:hypothetical protein